MLSPLLSPKHIGKLLAASSGDPNINLSDYLILKSGKKVSEVYSTPADMINLVVSNTFVIAGFLLFIFIIAAGFKIISSDSKGIQEGQTIITGVLTGFIIMFAAFWIIQILELITGVNIIF